ncbi:hypothetical protein AMTRI_Chr13g90170 [Amborella trichopoda]|uniref:Tubulin alpha chain n=1 Tax=Amborella trichopoda TaxID=13333 RepID=U5CW97_AMBTC|nr:uncharacterized protein LOC18442475 isoform X2 [Amborella trichopoda]ERN14220.1 hypothetical protein AMTR_s00033p00119910 [Amborella trichopoda]|eukprot:XP_006852753.1 uncharacterized protein LOC18442475 isoform X2 [Amborella trichopoda]
MACFQMTKPSLSPLLWCKSNCFCSEHHNVHIRLYSRVLHARFRGSLTVRCKLSEDNSDSNGEEPPESLFMKELRKRGLTPTSLLEDSENSSYGPGVDDMKVKEKNVSLRNRLTSTEIDKSLANQRERSIALNSEGLEGLIPRAKLLLTLGGTFFLGFWPLILATVAFFSALYIYFGPSFVHDATKTPVPPPYVDPYKLLEDERLSRSDHLVN